MLRLSPITRRSICRSLFLLLGVMPLLSSIAYATWHRYQFTESRTELQLAAVLGLDTRINSLHTPVPHAIQMDRAELLDSETGVPVLKATNVATLVDATEAAANEDVRRVHFDSLRIPRRQTQAAWQLLLDRVLKQRRLLERPLLIDADRVTLVTADGELHLKLLKIDVKSKRDEVTARIEFKLNEHDEQPVWITIRREPARVATNTTPSMQTSVRIETGDAVVPGSLFLSDIELAQNWGPHVTFQGVAWFDEVDGKYTGEVAGNIGQLQLERVLANRFCGSIKGTSSVEVSQATFAVSRFDFLKATLRIERGTIDTRLLQSLNQHMGVRIATTTQQSTEPTFAFDQANVEFRLDGKGLIMDGLCELPTASENAYVGILISDGPIPLAKRPKLQPQPSVNLLRALAGSDVQSFPLENPNCVSLWQWLPLPSAKQH